MIYVSEIGEIWTLIYKIYVYILYNELHDSI